MFASITLLSGEVEAYVRELGVRHHSEEIQRAEVDTPSHPENPWPFRGSISARGAVVALAIYIRSLCLHSK